MTNKKMMTDTEQRLQEEREIKAHNSLVAGMKFICATFTFLGLVGFLILPDILSIANEHSNWAYYLTLSIIWYLAYLLVWKCVNGIDWLIGKKLAEYHKDWHENKK